MKISGFIVHNFFFRKKAFGENVPLQDKISSIFVYSMLKTPYLFADMVAQAVNAGMCSPTLQAAAKGG